MVISGKSISEEKIKIIDYKKAAAAAVVASLVALILTLFFAFLVHISIFPEEAIPYFSYIIAVVCTFFAGYLISMSVKAYGLFNGIAAGVIFFFISFIVSAIAAPGFAINKKFFITLILSAASSGVGGIIGINLKVKRRTKRKRKQKRK